MRILQMFGFPQHRVNPTQTRALKFCEEANDVLECQPKGMDYMILFGIVLILMLMLRKDFVER